MSKYMFGRILLVLAVFTVFAAYTVSAEEPATPAPGLVAPTEPAAAPAPVPAAPPTVPTPVYGWNQEIAFQFGLSQSSFNSNWSQGGEDSLAWQSSILVQLDDDQADHRWDNTVKLGFGQIKAGIVEIKKSTDEINLESVYTFKLGIHVDPYLALKGLTQFTTGYTYTDVVTPNGTETLKTDISNFMDPGYFVESAGFGYTPNEMIKTRLGAAVRETFTNLYPKFSDDSVTEAIEKTKVEPGIESVTDLKLKLSDAALFTSNLAVFSNLKASDQIVVRWDNLLSLSIMKYITAGINFQLFYDKTANPGAQIKESSTLGLTYQYSAGPLAGK